MLYVGRSPRLKQRILRNELPRLLSAAAVIGIVLAGAADTQELPLPSTYFFPDNSEAMAAALLDPRISNETKQALARLS